MHFQWGPTWWSVVLHQLVVLAQADVTLRAIAGHVQVCLAEGGRAGLRSRRDVLLPLPRQFLLRHGQGVVHPKIVNDHRHRHGYGEHPCQRAQGSHQHAWPSPWIHVPIPQGGHGDYSPPEADRDIFELCVLTRWRVIRLGSHPLCVVDHGGKYQNTECQEDYQQQKFIGAGSQSVAQHPEAHEVPGELEDSQDPHEPHHPEETKHVLSSFGGEPAQAHF